MIGHVFGVSFCRVPDLLSQWRAYGLNGSGICIGFDSNELKSSFEEGVELVDVKYEQRHKIPSILELIHAAFERYQLEMRPLHPSGIVFAPQEAMITDQQGNLTLTFQKGEKRSVKEEEIIRNSLDDALSKLGAIAHTFKLAAFSEEQELRLVSRLAADGPELAKIQLRARGGKFIPYIEMKPTTTVLPIRRVITGPMSESINQKYALKIFLAQYGHLDVEIERSRFALR